MSETGEISGSPNTVTEINVFVYCTRIMILPKSPLGRDSILPRQQTLPDLTPALVSSFEWIERADIPHRPYKKLPKHQRNLKTRSHHIPSDFQQIGIRSLCLNPFPDNVCGTAVCNI